MNKKMKLLSVLGLVTAILFLFSPMVTAQSLSISGKVIDKNSQEPVIGASVLIEGTSNGTITDLDGNFMLSNVPSKGNLVVSYIGYATQTLCCIHYRTMFQRISFHRSDRSGKIHFFQHTITYHNNFIQRFGILSQDNTETSFSIDWKSLRSITNIRHD